MARREAFLFVQAAVLLALVLVPSIMMEGVRGEEVSDLGDVQDRRSLFVRSQLLSQSRGSSCRYNRNVCTRNPYPAGWLCCGDSCTSVQTDYNNCGYCGLKCGWSQTCCAGKCVYLASDSNNCGRCGQKCPRNECRYGVCKYNSRGF